MQTFKWIGVALLSVSLLCVGCMHTPAKDDNEKITVAAILDAVRDGMTGMNSTLDTADGEPLPPVATPTSPVPQAIGAGLGAVAPFVPQPYGGILRFLAGLVIPGFAWLRARGTAKQRQAEEEFLIRTLQQFKKQDPAGFKKLMAMRETANAGLDSIEGVIRGISLIKAGIA